MVRVYGVAIPTALFAFLVYAGVDPTGDVLIAFLICQCAGIVIYVTEMLHRHRHRR